MWSSGFKLAGSRDILSGGDGDQVSRSARRGLGDTGGAVSSGSRSDGFNSTNPTPEQRTNAEYNAHGRLVAHWLDANEYLDDSVNGPHGMGKMAAVELRSVLGNLSNEHLAESVEYVFRFTPHSWSPTLVSAGQRVILRALHQWLPTTGGLDRLIRKYPGLAAVRCVLEKFRPRSIEVSGIVTGRHFFPSTSGVRCIGNRVLLERVAPTIDRLLPLFIELVTTTSVVVESVSPARCFLKSETVSRKVHQVIVAYCAMRGGFQGVDQNEWGLPYHEVVAIPESSTEDKNLFGCLEFYRRMRAFFNDLCIVLNERIKLSEGALASMGEKANWACYANVEIKNRVEFLYFVALRLTLESFQQPCKTFAITHDHAIVSRSISLMFTMINIRFRQLKLVDIWGHFNSRVQFDNLRGRVHRLTKCLVSDKVYYEDDFVTCHHLMIGEATSDGDGIEIEPHEVVYRLIKNDAVECDLVARLEDRPPRVGEEILLKPLRPSSVGPTKVTPTAVHLLWDNYDQDPRVHDGETDTIVSERSRMDSTLVKMSNIPVVRRR